MQEESKIKRYLVQARLSPGELNTVEKMFADSACRTMSEYVRKVLLKKPVVVKHRNESLDAFMLEMILLRKELNAIGNNYNQVVKRLYTLQTVPEIKSWLNLHETAHKILIEKIADIKSRIAQINDQWLQ